MTLPPVSAAASDAARSLPSSGKESATSADQKVFERALSKGAALTYSTIPPIKELDTEEGRHIAAQFQECITDFSAGFSTSLWQNLAEKWTERSDDARWIGSVIESQADTGSTHTYMLGETPVAMMLLKHEKDGTKIKLLSTHPGVFGGGETMIEKAVNESQATGNDGRLGLRSMDEASSKFYKSVGFVSPDGKSSMTLDPEKSGLWTREEEHGVWRLNKHERSLYLVEEPPQPDVGRDRGRERERGVGR